MKIGIISDIHGNLPSLEAVLNAFDERGVDTIVCLGDLVGYFHQSLEVLNLIMNSDIVTILGNHEAYMLGILDCSIANWSAYNLDYVKRSIPPRVLEWLQGLPRELFMTVEDLNLAFFHGSPWRPLEGYVYPDSTSLSRFTQLSYDFVFLGHTHYQMVKTRRNTTIINPGSCGLPRDGGHCASAAIVYVGNDVQIELLHIEYDVDSFILSTREKNVNRDALEKLSAFTVENASKDRKRFNDIISLKTE